MAEELVIGTSLPESGDARTYQWYSRAYDLWVHDVNAEGGILGRPVRLLAYDDSSDGEKAAANYKRLIKEDRVPLLLGPCHSAILDPMAYVAEEEQMVLLEGSGSQTQMFRKGRRWLFLVWGAESNYMQSFLEFMTEPSNPQRIHTAGLIYGSGALAPGHAVGTRYHTQRLGLDLVFDEHVEAEPDYADIFKRAKTAGADVILWSLEARGPAKLKAQQDAVDAGFKPSQLWLSEEPGPAGGVLDGVFSRVTWQPVDPAPRSRKFLADFKNSYSDEPEYHSAGGYSCGQVLKQAVEAAGSLDNARVREALLNNTFATLLGPLRFDFSGLSISTFPVAQWQNGKPELVYPARAKTSAAVFG